MPIFACIRKELNSVMSVILFPGIKCHDVSSFTCLTCTLVFFVPIPGFTSHPSHCVRVCVCVVFVSVCVSLSAFSVKRNTSAHQCFRSDNEYCFCLCEHTNFPFFLYYYYYLFLALLLLFCPLTLLSPHRECCLSVPITSMHFVCHVWRITAEVMQAE